MKKTCPQLAKILGIDDTRLRYQLLNDPLAPPCQLKVGRFKTAVRYYEAEAVIAWWRQKQEKILAAKKPSKVPRSTPTKQNLTDWIALQRSNKWSLHKLSKHIGMGFDTLKRYIDKYEAGLLK